MAKKKATLEVEFERTDDTTKRLPTRAEMTQWMLAALSVPAAFCVRFVGLEEGQALNKTYRSKDYATNVLTFDYQHEPTAQADIVICTPVLVREAKEQNKSFRAHLAHLLVHSTLHAQGWDHETDDEADGSARAGNYAHARLSESLFGQGTGTLIAIDTTTEFVIFGSERIY